MKPIGIPYYILPCREPRPRLACRSGDPLGLECLLHRETMTFESERDLSVELGISSVLIFAWSEGEVLLISYFSEPLGNSRESFPEVFL